MNIRAEALRHRSTMQPQDCLQVFVLLMIEQGLSPRLGWLLGNKAVASPRKATFKQVIIQQQDHVQVACAAHNTVLP